MSQIRTAIVGCGSVSGPYLADLAKSPFVQLVSVCDAANGRAAQRAAEFRVPHHFVDFDAMLSGPPFDLLINLTAMQSHFGLNLRALQAGRHVLSEKPLAGTREQGRQLLETARARGLRLWAAPTVVTSPAFRCLAETLGSGRIGRVAQAFGRYGHGGPSWGPWFYQRGGGALFDLGVYNVTFLTGLLGPVKAVTAMMGTAIPERSVDGARVRVDTDDNTLLLLDHGDTVFSCIGTGFVYGPHREDCTVQIIGTGGSANLLGWDWLPAGVELLTAAGRELLSADQQGYSWEQGGSHLAECLATGKETLMTAEHAYHVLDVMLSAQEAAGGGRKLAVQSSFRWPLLPTRGGSDHPAAPAGLAPEKHKR